MTSVADPGQPVFYYDLGSPGCYLVGERIMSELAVAPEWEPVLGAALGLAEPTPDPQELARIVANQGLQPLRLPSQWPPQTELAMLAATYAKRIGRGVAFSLAAFRQAFAGGRDLGDEGTVLIAAAACEMHPTALLKAMGLRSVVDGLRQAGERARAAGADALPAIQVGDQLFCGPGALERASGALSVAAGGIG
jgi:2-hydroxychromene-2-carboxylate isomerase